MATGLESITNFLQVSGDLATAGQPTREQLEAVGEAGYDVVINLAMPTSTSALADEAEVVTGFGMDYVSIPVVWENPTAADLERFSAAMEQRAGQRVFAHCAMNMRVSAFVMLYRVLRQGVPEDEARATMCRIWEPNATWAQFIEEALSTGRSGGRG